MMSIWKISIYRTSNRSHIIIRAISNGSNQVLNMIHNWKTLLQCNLQSNHLILSEYEAYLLSYSLWDTKFKQKQTLDTSVKKTGTLKCINLKKNNNNEYCWI